MAPKWFELSTYVDNKLAQCISEKVPGITDAASLKAAFAAAGYNADNADSMYNHFVAFGNAENVSPNGYFDPEYYFKSKAASFNNTDIDLVTSAQIVEMKQAFANAGLSAWDHYLWFGMAEGIDASEKFDTSKYLEDKLALLQATDPAGNWTMESTIQAFKAAGLNPVMHYEECGYNETLSPTSVGGGGGNEGDVKYIWGDEYKTAVTGGADDDTFVALEDQLTSLHRVNGQGGTDTLRMTLGTAGTNGDIIAPILDSVETVKITGQQHPNLNAGDNLIGSNHRDVFVGDAAQIDAGNFGHNGMRQLWSTNSRADVVVEDVRTNSNVLKNVWQSADPGNVDFKVYIDPQHLKSADVSTSGEITIELMDVKNGELYGNRLQDNPFDKFSFEYTPDGGTTRIVALNLGKVKGTATYSDLLKAFQSAIAKEGLSSAIKAELSETTFTDSTFVGGKQYTCSGGRYIILSSENGTIAAPKENALVGWGVSTGTVPVTGGIVWDAVDAPSTTCPLIVTDIWLDNVARVAWDLNVGQDCLPDDILYGSQAGDMIVGSMADRGGVERFNVRVDEGSWLSSLSSTNNALRLVVAENGAIEGDNDKGNLFIGKSLAEEWYPNEREVRDPDTWERTNAAWPRLTGQDDDLTSWADPATFLQTDGLVDVAVFDGTAFEGQINIGASITEHSYAKYLRGVDGSHPIDRWAPLSGYDTHFSYLLGKNDDTLNMVVDGGIATDNDFYLEMNGGAGNDQFAFQYDFSTLNAVYNQLVKTDMTKMNPAGKAGIVVADLANVEINGDAGNDVVHLLGDGSVRVNGGAGRDVIYNHDFRDGAPVCAVWSVNTDGNVPAQVWVDPVNGAQPLDNDAISSYNEKTDIASGKYAEVRVVVKYMGVTSTATVSTSNLAAGQVKDNAISFMLDSDLNQLVIKAINDDPNDNMNHLLEAKDGAGYSLLLESLVGGTNTTDKPTITFQGKASGNDAKWTAISALNADYAAQATAVVGADGDAVSNNIINGGAGSDLIVLGTSDVPVGVTGDFGAITGSHDIVRFCRSFGKDIILNFTATNAYQGSGEDMLDFTDYFGKYSGNAGGKIATARAANTISYSSTMTAKQVGEAKGFANSVLLTKADGHDIAGVANAACYDVYTCVAKDGSYTYQGTFALIDENGAAITTITDVDVVTGYYA